jgi:hypothetical protein
MIFNFRKTILNISNKITYILIFLKIIVLISFPLQLKFCLHLGSVFVPLTRSLYQNQ